MSDLDIRESEEGGAILSADHVYRYRLWRNIHSAPGKRLGFVMLNPSTADGLQDDPTIRRCIGYARSWGYGRLEVVNLYAYRATKPRAMWHAAEEGEDIIGPDNTLQHESFFEDCDLVVCAWGANPGPAAAEFLARHRGKDLHALALSKGGQPKHPLFLRGNLTPVPFA